MIREYLTMLREAEKRSGQGLPKSYKFASPSDLLLRRGREFAPAPLTPDEADIVAAALAPDCAPKQCFYNSMMTVLNDDSETLIYTEGYTTSVGIPILHGWITVGDKVVDPTLKDLEVREYFGVQISTDAVRRFVLKRGYAGTMIDDWESRYELCRTGKGLL